MLLTYTSQLVKGGQYLVEVVQPLTYSSQLVKGGQYLLEVVQPLTYSSKVGGSTSNKY
jgi:hypothetical protein